MSIALVLALALSSAPPSVERAEQAWAEQRYEEAAEAYAIAYAETGDIAYLYARAQAEQRSGNCPAAIETYEAFIATQPKQAWIDAARAEMETCRARLPEPEPEPQPQPEPVPEPQPQRRSVDEPPQPPWHRDAAGASLVAAGIAVLGAGTTLAVVAQVNQVEAERAGDVVAYAEHNDRAVVLSRASIPVLAVGGAILVGGIVRFAVLARQRRRGAERVSLAEGIVVRF